MDDIYAVELLRQSLINASEREDELLLALQAAHKDLQDSKRRSIVSKIRFQELHEALESEKTDTNAERLARQEAEESLRGHRAELLKAKRMERIANDHCNVAESEILKLQRDLSTERSSIATANKVSTRLREDLRYAEIYQREAREELDSARIRIRTLQEGPAVANDRVDIVEHQRREFDAALTKERPRAEQAETGLELLEYELKIHKPKYIDILERYNELETRHGKCCESVDDNSIHAATLRADANKVDADSRRCDAVSTFEKVSSRSLSQELERQRQVVGRELDRGVEEIMLRRRESFIVERTLPAFPEPARLRLLLGSEAASQIERVKVNGRMITASKTSLREPWRKCGWFGKSNSLGLFLRGFGWMDG